MMKFDPELYEKNSCFQKHEADRMIQELKKNRLFLRWVDKVTCMINPVVSTKI